VARHFGLDPDAAAAAADLRLRQVAEELGSLASRRRQCNGDGSNHDGSGSGGNDSQNDSHGTGAGGGGGNVSDDEALCDSDGYDLAFLGDCPGGGDGPPGGPQPEDYGGGDAPTCSSGSDSGEQRRWVRATGLGSQCAGGYVATAAGRRRLLRQQPQWCAVDWMMNGARYAAADGRDVSDADLNGGSEPGLDRDSDGVAGSNPDSEEATTAGLEICNGGSIAIDCDDGYTAKDILEYDTGNDSSHGADANVIATAGLRQAAVPSESLAPAAREGRDLNAAAAELQRRLGRRPRRRPGQRVRTRNYAVTPPVFEEGSKTGRVLSTVPPAELGSPPQSQSPGLS
jgi:hypothetical protein